MSTCYELAGPEVHDLARNILETHHPELKMPDGEHVRLCIMFAFTTDDSPEPPVKCHGYPAAAVVSVIPYKQRVDKRADAEIILDQKVWLDRLTELQQRALLDHEITHLEIQVDDHGLVKTDDTGRPKLKLKLHDYELGGFRSIAKRYGEDALEVMEAQRFVKDQGDVMLTGEKLFA